MADQTADAESTEGADRGVEVRAVDGEVHPAVGQPHPVDAGHGVESGGRALGLGLHRRTGQVAHLAERPGLHVLPEPDDAHAVTELLDLGQDMAGEQYRLARFLRLRDDVLEDDLHERVESGRGLVQEQQLRVGRERGDDGDLLPVALGVRPALLGRVEVEAFDQLVPAPPVQSAAQLGKQVDGLAAGQVRPELDVTGYVGEPPVQGDGVFPRVLAEQLGGAGVGAQEPEQDADGGRLAGAVGAEEAVDLTGVDGEVEAVQCVRAAERLVQSGDGDCLRHDSERTLLSEICEVKEVYKWAR